MSGSASGRAAHLTEQLYRQPTLSLYMGGSGHRVGGNMLALMDGLDEASRAMIEPFFIDAQEPKIRNHERARHYCYRDLGEFYRPVYADFAKQRFPENLGASPIGNSCDGCGVTRIFGAASLVANRDDFAELIEGAVARLRASTRGANKPIQVFLTASSCGGTGAGMILDAAALVGHIFRERLAERPKIFLFLLAPEVFLRDPSIKLSQEQRARMQASNYALLKELHHFAQGHPFTSSYRLRDEDVRIGNQDGGDRLFDWVFYLDGKSESSQRAHGLDEMAWIVAESQLHLALSEVGHKIVESLPNQREERSRDFALHHVHASKKERLPPHLREQLERSARKTFLATLSVRNVRFPAQEIRQWFLQRWCRDGLATLLRGLPAQEWLVLK